MWQRHYTRWRAVTLECLDVSLLELMPPLATLCPPATVIDKTRYSGFVELKLLAQLREREADAVIISGSETDVCVLATVLSAVDLGYRVIVVRDAVCSSSDEGHDMLLRLYHTRLRADRDSRCRDDLVAVAVMTPTLRRSAQRVAERMPTRHHTLPAGGYKPPRVRSFSKSVMMGFE
jgi:hypothetical protein